MTGEPQVQRPPGAWRKGFTLVVLIVSSAIAIVLAAAFIAGDGWGILYEEPGVQIKNDTPRTVTVRLCSGQTCKRFHPPRTELSPGESTDVNVPTSGHPNVYLVLAPNGTRMGCLPLVMPRPTEGMVALVSHRKRCVGDIDEDTQWPPT